MSIRRPRILFVNCTPQYNLFNRKSAIDSILCSMLLQLMDTCDISVNGASLRKEDFYQEARTTQLSQPHPLARYIPKRGKQLIRDLRQFRHNDQLFQQIIAGEKPDMIIELMRYSSDLGARLKAYWGVPLLAYFDAPAVQEHQAFHGNISFYYNRVAANELKNIQAADRVIVYSQPVADHWLKQDEKMAAAKFRVFQTLDYTRLQFEEEKKIGDPPVIGFVGSFLKWHRVDMLLNAFESIRKKGLDARLLLVGAGEEFPQIQEQVAASPWKEDIQLTGFVDGDQLRTYRNQMDIGVMPSSNWYGIPTKVFEYGAAKIASVVPDTPTISYLFTDRENVLFFPNHDEAGLTRCLEILLAETDLLPRLGTQLQSLIQTRNSPEKAIEFYTGLIEELVGVPSRDL